MNSTTLYNRKLIFSLIAICCLIGITSSLLPWGALIFSFLMYPLILGIKNPLKVMVIVMGMWSIFQGFLAAISIGGYPLSQLFPVFLLLTLSMAVVLRGKSDNHLLSLTILYLFMVIWSFIGIFYSRYIDDAIVSYLRLFVGWLLFYYFATTVTSKKNNDMLCKILVVCGALSGILTGVELILYEKFGITTVLGFSIVSEYYGGVYRPSGGFGGPVASAISLFPLYVMSVYKYVSSKNRIYLITSICIVIGICSTLTRTVILALVSTILLQAFYYSYRRKTLIPLIKTLFIGLIVLCGVLTFAGDVVIGRTVDFLDTSSSDTFGGGRLGIWYSIIEGISTEGSWIQNILGYGISNSRYFVYKYSIFGLEDYTHNDYLDTFLSNGLIGLVLLLAFIIRINQLLFKTGNYKYTLFFAIPVLAHVTVIMTISNTQYSAGPRWIFLIALVYMLKEIQFSKK
ncbi:O-antigen ligase [Bacillus sp. NH11B]|uniref:O-antigen ligase family protein n=1 Tax=Bacillus sp. NH11B TaxID=1866314 RepID=UPI0008FDA128|nr:O-antigen ligase family protein [Bacillus sp. NH11B]OJD72948.1 hypothetical protein BAU27_20515 [Bacillus sp. NH11B]